MILTQSVTHYGLGPKLGIALYQKTKDFFYFFISKVVIEKQVSEMHSFRD